MEPIIQPEIDYEGLDHDSLAINMIAGAMAGIAEHAVMYPVDSIKVSEPPPAPEARGCG